MLFFRPLCLTTLILVLGASILANEDGSLTEANDYIDEILAAVRTAYTAQIDPLPVPHQNASFERFLGNFRLYGEMHINQGTLYGLSSIRRTADCFLGPSSDSGELTAMVRLGVDDLKMLSKVNLTVFGINREGNLTLTLTHADIDFKAVLKTGQVKPVVEKLSVVKLDGLKARFSDMGIMKRFLNAAARLAIYIFRSSIREVIEKTLQTNLNEVLANKDFKLSI